MNSKPKKTTKPKDTSLKFVNIEPKRKHKL